MAALPAAPVPLAALDRLRSAAFRFLRPGPWFYVRERRVGALALLGLAAALLGSLAAPMTLLLYGPLVLGVPHLLADLRYLVVRPSLHRRPALAVLCGVPLVATAVVPAAGLLAVLGAIVAARAPVAARSVVALGWVSFAAWGLRHPLPAGLLLLHVHNAVAMLLWWAWRRRPWSHLVPVALAVALYVALAAGALDAAVLGTGPLPTWLGADALAALSDGIAPGADLAAWHLLLAYGFAQALHYAAWLRLIPEDDRARRTPRPFVASWRALTADLGGLVPVGVFGLWAALLAWGAVDPLRARSAYLTGALAHVYLEVGAGLLAVLERRRPGGA